MLKPQDKEGLIGFGAAIIVFWLLTRTLLKREEKITGPKPSEENINVSLDAYMMAVQDNAAESVLNDLNMQTARDYGVRVYHKPDGRFIATDLDGNTIKTV